MINWLLFNIHYINLFYALIGLAILALSTALAVDYFYNKQKFYRKFVAQYVWYLITMTIFGGVATTLLYSEVFSFVPCSLCWLQRVALYSQLLLLLTAIKLKDRVYFPRYGITLSAFGLLVALYQYLYQALPTTLLDSGLLPCLADGSADCAKTVMEVFGFVTFPFLSGVLFIFLITLYLHVIRSKKSLTTTIDS